ncbi:MAG: serine acetyltransferase [Pseudomonadota bacterium]|nr:serine acetyltransferase [Pseudomonadota bacterium]
MYALKADTYRVFGRLGWRLTLQGVALNQAFRVVASARLCQAAQRCPPALRWLALPAARILHHWACQRAGIELPWRTAMAPGLAVRHGRGLVVHVHSRIGRNVTLFQGVTLGQQDYIASDGRQASRYPVIEDDVWIGPYAIVSGVTVGKGSRIAAGAYVYQDVPAYCVVLGNPGQIVQTDCTPDVSNRFDG